MLLLVLLVVGLVMRSCWMRNNSKEFKLMYSGKNAQFKFWLEWLDNGWAQYHPVRLGNFYSRR